MATDDDDAATLRERVRDLEQTVAQQQDTIQQLMPSRRAILAGGAGLVGGAALTGQASAQSAAGQVGTSSEPVDVEAATVNADSVNTDSLSTELEDGSDVSNNRSYSTVYQNTSGNDLLVFVKSNRFGAGQTGFGQARVAENSSDIGSLFTRIFDSSADGDTAVDTTRVSFKVPAGYYYEINANGDLSTVGINYWVEREVTSN